MKLDNDSVAIASVAMHTMALLNFHFHKHKSMSYNTFFKIQKQGLNEVRNKKRGEE